MNIFTYIFGALLIAAGIYHFVNPAFYFPLMPDWFPKELANSAGGLAEIIIGGAMLYPPTRTYGLWAAAGLMLIFLPLHFIDLQKENPVVGSKTAATVRLVIQFILIGVLVQAARRSASATE